jgi:hypothetical protein
MASVLAIVAGLAGIPNPSYGQDKDLSSQEKHRLNQLKDGKETVTADDKALLDKTARFHLHRLTQDKYWKKQPPENRTLVDFVEDTFKLIPLPTPQKPLTDPQQQYMEAFTTAFLGPIDEALHHREPIVRVNAARILARIAEAGQEKSAEELLKILKDKDQNDAVKFLALRGFEGLFNASYTLSAVPVNERPNRRAFKNSDLEDQCIVALAEFVLRKPSFSSTTTSEEKEAFRYVRRQAIRALAQTRFPAIMNKKQFVGTPTALVLVRVLADDGITPTASLSEKLDAAIGLCQLQTNLAEGFYQPDYAAHAVGQFIADLAKEYDEKKGVKAGDIKPYPWSYYAATLIAVLQAWKEANPNDKYIADLVQKYQAPLQTLRKQQGSVDVNALQSWLSKPPPNSSLFKGHPKTAVKQAEASSN